jgi:ferredoxin
MQFKQLQSFRIFIYLLLTVFFTGTVYASGMMVADQLCANHTVNTESHNHDGHDMIKHDHHKQDAGQKQSTNDHCSKCGHCMACFTILPPSQLEKVQSQVQAIEVTLFEPSYHSYVSAQPQRPPIF